jgi:hypothetical protein
MGCIGPCYPYFDIFIVLALRGILVFVFLLGPINRTLEEWSSLPLLLVSFRISILERVSHEIDFYFQ